MTPTRLSLFSLSLVLSTATLASAQRPLDRLERTPQTITYVGASAPFMEGAEPRSLWVVVGDTLPIALLQLTEIGRASAIENVRAVWDVKDTTIAGMLYDGMSDARVIGRRPGVVTLTGKSVVVGRESPPQVIAVDSLIVTKPIRRIRIRPSATEIIIEERLDYYVEAVDVDGAAVEGLRVDVSMGGGSTPQSRLTAVTSAGKPRNGITTTSPDKFFIAAKLGNLVDTLWLAPAARRRP